MGLVLSVAPTELAVSVGECRKHARILTTADDAELEAYIRAAIDQAQVVLNRQLVSATYLLKMDGFCDPLYSDGWTVKAPNPPLVSVTSITYLDTTGTSQTLSSTRYVVGTSTEPGRLTPAVSYTWPDTQSERIETVTITYVAGYGTAAQVPWGIKVAIMQMVSSWYEQRESIVIGTTVMPIPNSANRLLKTFSWGSYS